MGFLDWLRPKKKKPFERGGATTSTSPPTPRPTLSTSPRQNASETTWAVIAGAQAEEEAVRKRVIGQGQAVVLIISFPVRPKFGYLIRGTVTCHGCQAEIPFEIRGNMGLGGGDVTCSGCGSRVSIAASSDYNAERSEYKEFVWASPLTSASRRPKLPNDLTIRTLDGTS